MLDVSVGILSTPASQFLPAAFTTLNLPDLIIDTANGWNAATNQYTIPTTGIYTITSQLRTVDNTSNANIGQGVNTSNTDGSWFVWEQFQGKRTTILNTRTASFTAGQVISMFAYCDSPVNCKIQSARLTITGPGDIGSTGSSISSTGSNNQNSLIPIVGTLNYNSDGSPGGTLPTAIDSGNTIAPVQFAQSGNCLTMVYTNVQNGTEVAGPPMTLAFSVEPVHDSGVLYQFTFNGQPTVHVQNGQTVTSDPLFVNFNAGTVGSLRAYFLRDAGQSAFIPANYQAYPALTLTPATSARTGGMFDGCEVGTTTTINDLVTTAGNANISSATAPFTTSHVGNNISIGGTLYTISAYTSASAVTLSSATGLTTATGQTATISFANKTMFAGVTTLGSIQPLNGYGIAPNILLGSQVTNPNAVTAAILSDSIGADIGSNLGLGSYARIALSGPNYAAGLSTKVATKIGYHMLGQPGETVANLLQHHQYRFRFLNTAKYTIGDITNDVYTGTPTLSSIQANFLLFWNIIASSGTKPYYSTITPRTTSLNQWLDIANQTIVANDSIRVAFNGWMRDGAPFDTSTGLAVAVGTTGGTIARAQYISFTGTVTAASGPAHPLAGAFELADGMETSRNSGIIAPDPANRVITGASITAGSTALTATGGNFTSADYNATTNRYISIAGAGTSGGYLNTRVGAYISPTQVTLKNAAITTVSGASGVMGGPYGQGTVDGIHPSPAMHGILGLAVQSAVVNNWT